MESNVKKLIVTVTSAVILIVILVTAIHFYPYLRQKLHTLTQNPPINTVLFPPDGQGLYESCSPQQNNVCFGHLKRMAAAGFKIVLNYDQLYGTAQEENSYAKEATSLGIKIIWSMNDPTFWNGGSLLTRFYALSTSCGCTGNYDFIRFFINLVKKLPATWGYYIGDETSVNSHAQVKAFTDYVKVLDPSHPRIFVTGENNISQGSNVQLFTDTADVIGADIYPISTPEPISAVGDIARATQSMADRNGKRTVFVLQAFNFGEYSTDSIVCSPFPKCARFPTREEMQEMRNLALNNSQPVFILWYSYFDIFRSDQPSTHWTDLITAAGTGSLASSSL